MILETQGFRMRVTMLALIPVVFCVAGCSAASGGGMMEQDGVNKYETRKANSKKVKIGDSIQKVIEVMGKPDDRVKISKTQKTILTYYMDDKRSELPNDNDKFVQFFFDKNDKLLDVLNHY